MLLKIKTLIAKPVYFVLKQFYFRQFNDFLNKNQSYKSLYIFDLDNTLAHTYPQLNNPDKNKMYQQLPPHQNMLATAISEIEKGQLCIILSARDYKYKSATKMWIQKNLKKEHIPTFLVPKAKDKLSYLLEVVKRFDEVIYYDDLSYNHEKGEVKYYTDIIAQVRKLPIQYYGYDQINRINNA